MSQLRGELTGHVSKQDLRCPEEDDKKGLWKALEDMQDVTKQTAVKCPRPREQRAHQAEGEAGSIFVV